MSLFAASQQPEAFAEGFVVGQSWVCGGGGHWFGLAPPGRLCNVRLGVCSEGSGKMSVGGGGGCWDPCLVWGLLEEGLAMVCFTRGVGGGRSAGLGAHVCTGSAGSLSKTWP